MILVILLLIPTPILIFNNNGLDNVLYAKGKANISQDDRAKNDIHTNEDMQNQEQVTNKVVILTFGDVHKSQVTIAKPILDQYGFKGSFFVPCEMVGGDSHMDWNDIETLYNEGHDIEANSGNSAKEMFVRTWD